MQKKLAKVLLLILILTLFIPALVFGEEMKDLETSPYKEEILKLIEDGALSGYPDGTFRPEKNITRGEFAKMITNALKLEEDKEGGKFFKDVVGKWHQGAVGAVYKAGLMVGTGEDKFEPEENITREQMVAVVIRGLKLEELSKELKLESEFKDSAKISSWAKYQIGLAQKIGLLSEMDNFNPLEPADRQTVAKLTYELVYNREIYKKNFDTIIKPEEDVNEEKPEEEKDEEKNKEEDKFEEEKPSYDAIVSKYTSQLQSLQSKYTGELNNLYSQAKSEYEDGGKPTEIYNKYSEIAMALESQADAEVSSVLSQLENELIKYGYDTFIVNELQMEYERIKSETEDSLLNPKN